MIIRNIALVSLIAGIAVSANAFNLSGRVEAFGFNTYLKSCTIKLRPESPTAKADSTVTDANGRYSFPAIWPGVYTVKVTIAGYADDSLFVVVDGDIPADFALVKLSNIVGNTVPDTLKKANSPYIFNKKMEIGHSIYIEPGVSLALLDTLKVNGPKLLAQGTAKDSIIIMGKGQSSALYVNSKSERIGFCSVRKICEFRIGVDSSDIKAEITNSAFYGIPVFFVENKGAAKISLNKNIIDSCGMIMGLLILSDTVVMNKNIITQNCYNLYFTIYSHSSIQNNDIWNYCEINSNKTGDTIINNIFTNCAISGKIPFLAYNFFNGNITDINGMRLPGVGNTIIKNDNGYPCDLYFNIYPDSTGLSSEVIDIQTGELAKNSPCIRAGMRGVNVGVWQGPTGIADRFPSASHSTIAPVTEHRSCILPSGNGYGFGNRSGLNSPSGKVNVYSLNGRRLAVISAEKEYGRQPRRISSGVYVLEQLQPLRRK
jgi:hypothetical protein